MHEEFHHRIRDALDRVPLTANPEGRDTLLEGIPRHLVEGFYRYPANKPVDLMKLIEQLDRLGQLETTGGRPLLIFLENARKTVAGTLAGRVLQDLIEELEHLTEEDLTPLAPPASSLPAEPEVLIFGGNDERLPYAFFEGAIRVQKSIVRLHVPRIFTGRQDNTYGCGTGWLITSDLLLTNHHVIEARKAYEVRASAAEFQAQAEHTVAWFDYHTEEGTESTWPCTELVYANRELDYALLRLQHRPNDVYRPPLSLVQQQSLTRADRLNIVQHPGGRPLRYAIRNNFYIGFGETSHFIRYLTDTEAGASGSPVFDDTWLVVAMHHQAKQVPPESYKGETIKYHNEGIEIHAIIDDLPEQIQQEISRMQGWEYR